MQTTWLSGNSAQIKKKRPSTWLGTPYNKREDYTDHSVASPSKKNDSRDIASTVANYAIMMAVA